MKLVKSFDNEQGFISGPNVTIKVLFSLSEGKTNGTFRFGPEERPYAISLFMGKIPVNLIGPGVEAKVTLRRLGQSDGDFEVVTFFAPD